MTLICPRCRRIGGEGDPPELAGQLLCRRLEPEGDLGAQRSGWLRCGCGARYPVIDGIPVVLRDLDGFLASEGAALLVRQDLEPEFAEELAIRSGGALARAVHLSRVYAGSPPSPLTEWLAERVAEAESAAESGAGDARGGVLESGCGRGMGAGSLGLDWNFALLRAHRGPKVCGDAHDPPLVGGSFGAVVLANVLDSCRDPYLVLAQAAGLLRPGGRLILSCALAFDDAITMPGGRFAEEALIAGLSGGWFGQYRPGLRLVERRELDWELRISARTAHRHRALALIAEREG